MFPRIYENCECPIEGYGAFVLRILANPTGAEKMAWYASFAGLSGGDTAPFGAAALPILGETRAEGLDFSTVEAGAETIGREDLPDEFLEWILTAPGNVWAARSDDLKKKLQRS